MLCSFFFSFSSSILTLYPWYTMETRPEYLRLLEISKKANMTGRRRNGQNFVEVADFSSFLTDTAFRSEPSLIFSGLLSYFFYTDLHINTIKNHADYIAPDLHVSNKTYHAHHSAATSTASPKDDAS